MPLRVPSSSSAVSRLVHRRRLVACSAHHSTEQIILVSKWRYTVLIPTPAASAMLSIEVFRVSAFKKTASAPHARSRIACASSEKPWDCRWTSVSTLPRWNCLLQEHTTTSVVRKVSLGRAILTSVLAMHCGVKGHGPLSETCAKSRARNMPLGNSQWILNPASIFLLQWLEPVMNFPACGVARENRARRGGGRRLW